jgi:hypothetical protein
LDNEILPILSGSRRKSTAYTVIIFSFDLVVLVVLFNGNVEFSDSINFIDIFVSGNTDEDGLCIENVVGLGNSIDSNEFEDEIESCKQNNYDISYNIMKPFTQIIKIFLKSVFVTVFVKSKNGSLLLFPLSDVSVIHKS